jgi:hypothetical protein
MPTSGALALDRQRVDAALPGHRQIHHKHIELGGAHKLDCFTTTGCFARHAQIVPEKALVHSEVRADRTQARRAARRSSDGLRSSSR